MFYKSLIVSIALTASAQASAAELNLVCANSATGEIRTVLVGQEKRVRALRVSSESKRIRKLAQYAVVIELVPGKGNEGATEEFETLDASQFKLTSLVTTLEGQPSYKFNDKKNRSKYDCSLNHENQANPAVSRSN